MNYYPQSYSSSTIKTSGRYCPLSKSCPLLGGEPASKVLNQRNYLSKRVEEMEGLFALSQKEIERLKNHITQLKHENNLLKEDSLMPSRQLLKKPFLKEDKTLMAFHAKEALLSVILALLEKDLKPLMKLLVSPWKNALSVIILKSLSPTI